MLTAADMPGEIASTLVGSSAAAVELRQETELAGRVSARVLIVGETGVGKERLARTIHRRSIRCRGPFVAVQCAGSEAQIEFALFGRHASGGAFHRADGGTLFLDGVDRLTASVQLRLAQQLAGEGQIRDDETASHANVRIIATASAPFDDRTRENGIRPELYYLLNTIYIPVPPLRERREDVEPLLEFFTRYYARRHRIAAPALTTDARAQCQTYEWPGNLRQLEAVAAMMVLAQNGLPPHEIFERTARAVGQPLADDGAIV